MQDLTFTHSIAPQLVTSNITPTGVDITTAQGAISVTFISDNGPGGGTIIPSLATSDDSNYSNATAVNSNAFVSGSLSNITNAAAASQTVCVDKRNLKNYVFAVPTISGSTNIGVAAVVGQRKQVA